MKHRHCLKTEATTKEKKSIILPIMICCALVGTPMAALAKTVYYKGTAVYWNYGRNAKSLVFQTVIAKIMSIALPAMATLLAGSSQGRCRGLGVGSGQPPLKRTGTAEARVSLRESIAISLTSSGV
jgi:hypothetical protein